MDMNNLFAVATRNKFRFPYKGSISVEDLWDLSVKNLDTVFKALNAEAKQAKEESLLAVKSAEETILEMKIEIVKYMVSIKQHEAEERTKDAAKNERRRQIMEIIANKENEELHNMPIDKLRELYDSLG